MFVFHLIPIHVCNPIYGNGEQPGKHAVGLGSLSGNYSKGTGSVPVRRSFGNAVTMRPEGNFSACWLGSSFTVKPLRLDREVVPFLDSQPYDILGFISD